MFATIVTTDEELEQILALAAINHRDNVSAAEKKKEGFISWQYSFDLLQKMQQQQPHVIIKEGTVLVAYALVALKEAKVFHKDLAAMINSLENLTYNGKPLSDYNYYVMGQVCVNKAYRGKGAFEMLYKQHKQLFKDKFDFVVTEISRSNTRSIRAHEKVGFKTIFTYKDSIDEWDIVLWNWK